MLITWTIVGLLITGIALHADGAQTSMSAQDARGPTALEHAVTQGDISSVLALIHAGVDVNAKGFSGRPVLLWAATQGRLEIVRALARAGADVNVKDQQGWTPLTLAFSMGNFDVVQALIEAGAEADRDQLRKDVNKTDEYGTTALWGRIDLSSLRGLVQLGADVNARDNSGRTVLTEAADRGNLDKVRVLVELGADVNVKDKRGWTPLLLASQMGHTAVVQALIEAGADADLAGPSGWNALMRASYFKRLETVRVLIPATKVNYRTDEGITALMLARWACDPQIVDALSRAGAASGAEEWMRAPRFEDFPVERVYKGVPAPVDLHSNPKASSYRTRLRAAARGGPDFAGHYTAVCWGCGSNCQSSMIVDAFTGRVYDGIVTDRGTDFQLNSSLIIADPATAPPGFAFEDSTTDHLPVRYYVWDADKLKLTYEEACSVIGKNQKCGCENLKESMDHPALK
jgi:ankyrin repeat protein